MNYVYRATATLIDRRRKDGSVLFRALRGNTNLAAGLLILALMVLLVIAAPLVARQDASLIDTRERLQSPSPQYWFGSDQYGRDVYSRTVYGSRVSMIVGLSVGLVAAGAGTILGLVSGYFRKLDMPVMRVMDAVMAIPGLLLAIALMALLGPSLQNVVVALSIGYAPPLSRVVRSTVLSLREQEFVEAATAIGATPLRIMVFHIFPSIRAPLIVQGTYIVAAAMLTEAALSFLGAGVPPDVPSWGNMIAEGRQHLRTAVWIIVPPGILLSTLVLAVNLAGDGLRDLLDPKVSRG